MIPEPTQSRPKIRKAIYASYIISFIDLFAVSLFLPLISKQIRDLGASTFLVGIIGSVYGAIQLFSSPLVGWGSDLYGRKIILLVALAACAVAYVLQGGATSLVTFVIARTIAGTFKHTQTIGKAVVTDLYPHHKSYVIGNFNAFGSAGFIIGPTLGGYLVEKDGGFETVCYLAAAAFLVNIILLLSFVPDSSSSKKDKEEVKYKKLEDGNKNEVDGQESSSPAVAVLTILSLRFLFSFATLVPRSNLPITLEDKFGASIVSQGYLNSLQALASTLSGFAVGPVIVALYKEDHRAIVIHAGVFKLISLIFLFFAPSFLLAGLALILQSAVDPFMRAGLTAMSLAQTDDPGAILGFGQTATSFSRMLAPTAASIALIVSEDGPPLLGAVTAAAGIYVSLFLIPVRRVVSI